MSKVSQIILSGYLLCDDLKQKWQNIRDSFYHKDEGQIISAVDSENKTLTLSGGENVDYGYESPFSDTIISRINNDYKNSATASLNADISIFEVGASTDVKFTFSVTANEDAITKVTFNDVEQTETNGVETFTTTESITKTLVVERTGDTDITKTATANERYKWYKYNGDTATSPTDSTAVRALTSNGYLSSSNTAIINTTIPVGVQEISIYTKSGKTVSGQNPNTKEAFSTTQTTINVVDGGGNDTEYTKNTFDFDNGFLNEQSITITIS